MSAIHNKDEKIHYDGNKMPREKNRAKGNGKLSGQKLI